MIIIYFLQKEMCYVLNMSKDTVSWDQDPLVDTYSYLTAATFYTTA